MVHMVNLVGEECSNDTSFPYKNKVKDKVVSS